VHMGTRSDAFLNVTCCRCWQRGDPACRTHELAGAVLTPAESVQECADCKKALRSHGTPAPVHSPRHRPAWGPHGPCASTQARTHAPHALHARPEGCLRQAVVAGREGPGVPCWHAAQSWPVTGCASRHRPKAYEHVVDLHVPVAADKAGGNTLVTGCRLIILTHEHSDHTSTSHEHFCGDAPCASNSTRRMVETEARARGAANVLVELAGVVSMNVCDEDVLAACCHDVAASFAYSQVHDQAAHVL